MLQQIRINATTTTNGKVIDTDTLARIFGTNGNAINIKRITWIRQVVTAQELWIGADQSDQERAIADPFNFLLVNYTETNDTWFGFGRPGYKTWFNGETNDLASEISRAYSKFPVYNNLHIFWSSVSDFSLEFDYEILDEPLDYREEIMDLLANKTQVEDPSGSNVDGKRVLTRALLRTTGN